MRIIPTEFERRGTDGISTMLHWDEREFKPWEGKVYLSGPMTGHNDFNYPRFNRVALTLRMAGFTVKNPAENFNGDKTRPRVEYMRADIKGILKCKRVLLLPHWRDSQGSRLEYNIACELGLPVFELQTPLSYPLDALTHWQVNKVILEAATSSKPSVSLRTVVGGKPSETPFDYWKYQPPRLKTVLDKAAEAVDGPRRSAYGHPAEDFSRAAGAISAILAAKLKTPLCAADIPLIMACVKLSRQANRYGEDNLVDLAGYARCAQMVHEYGQQGDKNGKSELRPIRDGGCCQQRVDVSDRPKNVRNHK